MAVSPGHPASLLYPLRHHSPIAVTNSFFCIHSLKHTVTRYQSINHSTMLTITIFLTDSLTQYLWHTVFLTIPLCHPLSYSHTNSFYFWYPHLSHFVTQSQYLCDMWFSLSHFETQSLLLHHSISYSLTYSFIYSLAHSEYFWHSLSYSLFHFGTVKDQTGYKRNNKS